MRRRLRHNDPSLLPARSNRQTMNIEQHAVGLLCELIPKARYESRGQSITGTDYRNAWNSPMLALSRGWISTKVTPPEGFEGS